VVVLKGSYCSEYLKNRRYKRNHPPAPSLLRRGNRKTGRIYLPLLSKEGKTERREDPSFPRWGRLKNRRFNAWMIRPKAD